MALKTFGARVFAALTFAAVTLHGGDASGDWLIKARRRGRR